MTRLRVVGWLVQPVCMLDDGENLTPLQVSPIQVPVADWEAFCEGGWKERLDILATNAGCE